MRGLVLALVLVAISPAAHAGCGYVRLDESPTGSMADVPVINQTSLSVCYSAAAVQLVDAWRFSHGEQDKKKVTSFLAAAIDTGEDPDLYREVRLPFHEKPLIVDKRRSEIGWGHVSDVLNYLHKGYACDARALVRGGKTADQGWLLKKLQRTYTEYRVWKFLQFFSRTFALSTPDIDRREYYATAAVSFLKDMGYSPEQIPQIEELERALDEPNPLLYVQQELNAVCEMDRYKTGVPKPVYLNSRDVSALRKRVDTVLDRVNAQPLGVAFCGNILKEGKSYKSACWGHAAVIMGRRFNWRTGSCELLVRNSWGTSCAYAKSSGFECLEGEGNLWIPAKVLLSNTWQLSNFE